MKKEKPALIILLLPLIALGLSLFLNQFSLVKRAENISVDSRFKFRAAKDQKADSRILLVGISEKGLKQFGRWPWPRSYHGKLLRMLSYRPPAAIGFDLLFTEPSQDPAEDTAFADSLILHPGAITGASAENLPHLRGATFTEESIGATTPISNFIGDISNLVGQDTALLPLQEFSDSCRTGFVNVDPSDDDSVRRKAPLVVRVGSKVYPSFILQLLMSSQGVWSDQVEVSLGEYVKVNGNKETFQIPIDAKGRMWINYRGTSDSGENDIFSGTGAISYFGLLVAANEHATRLAENPDAQWMPYIQIPEGDRIELSNVKDQILIVGQAAAGLTDFGPTPIGSQTPLFKVHAMALNNILQNDYLKAAPTWPLILGFLLITYLTVIYLKNAPVWISVLIPLSIIAAYLFSSYFLFASHSLLLPIVWPVFGYAITQSASVTHRLVHESKAKEKIRMAFSTYVAPEVVNQIIESGEEPKLGGEEIEITAFFSDIQSFSAFSEELTAPQLVSLLNEYLSEMSYILKNEGSGTVDKYIGDAIVGIFGAPYPFPNHAYQACAASVKMQAKQAELRERWKKTGDWPNSVKQMRTRIGLNTGKAVVGNMGGQDRMNYTMMGDTVNLAARMESGAKSYGAYAMVTGETKESALETGDGLAFRYLDKIIVKGRTQPAKIYELVGLKSDLPSGTLECISIFEKGIEAYLDRDWDKATKLFNQSGRLEPFKIGEPGIDDNPSTVLIERCQYMKGNPPEKDWDGTFVMKTK